jgi:hypothetical protein
MAGTLNESSLVSPFNSSRFELLSETASVILSCLFSTKTGIRDGTLSPLTANTKSLLNQGVKIHDA